MFRYPQHLAVFPNFLEQSYFDTLVNNMKSAGFEVLYRYDVDTTHFPYHASFVLPARHTHFLFYYPGKAWMINLTLSEGDYVDKSGHRVNVHIRTDFEIGARRTDAYKEDNYVLVTKKDGGQVYQKWDFKLKGSFRHVGFSSQSKREYCYNLESSNISHAHIQTQILAWIETLLPHVKDGKFESYCPELNDGSYCFRASADSFFFNVSKIVDWSPITNTIRHSRSRE